MKLFHIFAVVVVGLCAVDASWAGLTTEGREEEEPIITSGQCGTNVFWDFDNATGVLTFTGSGDMKSYSSLAAGLGRPPWEHLKPYVEKIVIDEEITSIGAYAFELCTNVKSVNIPDKVTKINSCSFKKCSSLESIKIPDGVKSIEMMAFESCNSLKTIIIPDNVTKIAQYAFSLCTQLTTAKIGKSVSTIEQSAFSRCTRLESIILPEKITKIDMCTFMGCSALKSIIIPAGVTSIDINVFHDCPNLQSIGFLGTKDIPSRSVFYNTPKSLFVCVPDEYEASTFCTKSISKNSTICGALFKQDSNHEAVFDVDSKAWVLIEKEDLVFMSRSDRIQTATVLAYLLTFIFAIVILH